MKSKNNYTQRIYHILNQGNNITMIDSKVKEIRNFCETNSNPDIIKKYQKYFKEGYDGYGIDDKVFKRQIEIWVKQWKEEMTIESYLDLGDELMKNGRFDEKHVAISFLKSSRTGFFKGYI